MKFLLLLSFIVTIACCNNDRRGSNTLNPDSTTNTTEKFSAEQPTVFPDHSDISASMRTDSILMVLDSVRSKLFIANYKLERVKYYLNICLRKPSQDKFLKGWIRRAVE